MRRDDTYAADPASGRSIRRSDPAGPAGSPAARAGRPHRRGKAIAIWTLAVVGVLVLTVAAYGYWFLRSVGADLKPAEATAERPAPALAEKEPKAPFTILLIGADNMGAAGDSRSDSLIFGKVDVEAKRVWLISIPRDTRVEIEGHGTKKINMAYQYGGAALSVEVVSELLDIPINHYMEIDIKGFREVVDALGGVWIDVDTEIDDPKAAAANPGRAGQHIEPGYQLLDGNQALVYVRSRDFPDADFTRMRHQQEFFKALAKQSLDRKNLLKIPGMVRAVARFTTTDMSVGEIIDAASALMGMDGEIETATLRGEWVSPYVRTDTAYQEYLLSRLKAGVSFDATSTPAGSILPSDISVDVRNGSTVAGAAAEAAEILTGAGFDIEEIGNAKSRTFTETTIVYDGDPAKAEMVAEALGIGTTVANDGSWLIDTDVLVVIGSDWGSAPRGDATRSPGTSGPPQRRPTTTVFDRALEHPHKALRVTVPVELLFG